VPRNRPWAKTDLSYVPEGVDATYFDYPALPVITRATNGSTLSRRLLPLIASYSPDVILSFWVYPDGYAAVRVGSKLNIPVVVQAIGSDLNCVDGGLQLRQVQEVLRKSDVILTVSGALRQRAIDLGADSKRAQAIVNGCDTSIFHVRAQAECRRSLGIDADATLVVFVGRLDILKGVVELVHACKLIEHRFPSLRLVMIGEGPAKAAVEHAAATAGFSDRLQSVPRCTSAEVARWLGASDVFTLPSYNEGCPNAIVEALRCGRPVVATRVGGIPELVDEQNGILVPPRDVPALAEALTDSLTRSWDPAQIEARGRRSWQDVAKEVYAVCESVTLGRPSTISNSGSGILV
jgi:teichuronic acid biosynthesis glycosyltransferase TuaC